MVQEVEEGVLEAVGAQNAAGCCQSLLEEVICEQELVENCLHHQNHCHHQNLLPPFPPSPVSQEVENQQAVWMSQGTLSHQTQQSLRGAPFDWLGSRTASPCTQKDIQERCTLQYEAATAFCDPS